MVPEYEELKKKRPELYSTISFFDFITPGKSPFLPHPVLRKVGKSNEIIDRVYQSDYKSGIFFIEKICEYLKKSFFGKDLNLALKYIYPKCFKE